VPTIVHLLLALLLTVFLAVQARSLAFVLRSRRAVAPPSVRRRTDLLWTCIPVLLVLFLAARSWLVVVDVQRPAAAATAPPAQASVTR
jgi:heme/copper-type cytochrome/quinol oxidase subunit 2